MDNKVYYPEEIQDQPMLEMTSVPQATTQTSVSGVYQPAAIQDQPIPSKRIAQELISSMLNTKSKKILGAFQFTPSGALQIGQFELGVSGDIKISPNGIVARDASGENTLELDGDSGDGVFRGKLAADTFMGANGNVVVEESSNGNGRIVIYTGGLASILIGDPS